VISTIDVAGMPETPFAVRRKKEMSGRLQGRTAIVTGAARGIGAGIATVLAEAGAAVVLVDRNRDLAEAVAARIREAGCEAKTAIADVSRKEDLAAAAAAAMSWRGRIDIVCPNAAIFDSSPIVDMAEDVWDRLLGVNLKGVFLTVQACAKVMIRQGYGRVVATSSITGSRTAIPGMAHYAASKAGINGFVRAAAIEFAPHGITVNAIEPGHAMTEGAAPGYDAGFLKEVESFIPIGRIGQPEDMARVALFLASDDARYVTGQTIVVDGGVTLPEYPPYRR
jgi:3-oxoacyl-[acyl-carrier protein] reductase